MALDGRKTPQLGAKSSQTGAKMAPKATTWSQDGLKTPQLEAKMPPKTSQLGPKMPPKTSQLGAKIYTYFKKGADGRGRSP